MSQLTPGQIALQKINARKVQEQAELDARNGNIEGASQNPETQANQEQTYPGKDTRKEAGKVFYARVPHSRFIYSDGTEEVFHFGRATVINHDHIKELEAICPPHGNNPMIYTADAPIKVPSLRGSKIDPMANAITDVDKVQTEAANRNSRIAQEVGQVVVSGPSGANESTLDHELMELASGNANTMLGKATIVEIDPANLPDNGAMSSAS